MQIPIGNFYVILHTSSKIGSKTMIEKYFLIGARLTWTHPRDFIGPMDGSIVNSPPGYESEMKYNGMDGDLYNVAQPTPLAVGLTKDMNIPYKWLTYAPGRTSKRMLAAGDVLTGRMSGCYIVTWTENGQRWVGHVGTVDNQPAANRQVKANFAAAMRNFQNVSGFSPLAAWSPNEIGPKLSTFKRSVGPSIMALVTTSGAFYSLLMFSVNNDWCVGGMKLIPPMNGDALRREFAPVLMGGRR
jgi:hypothetical protein